MSVDVKVITEEFNTHVLETRLYADGYGTITLLDSLGFELKQYDTRAYAGEQAEEFHDRLAEMMTLEGEVW